MVKIRKDHELEEYLLDQEFIRAVRNGDIKGAEAALAAGADILYANGGGLTALHEAALEKHAEMAAFLIGKGADIEARDDNGDTPLMHSISRDDAKTTARLISLGADIDAQNKKFETPLMKAVMHKAEDCVLALLAKKPRLELWDCTNRTALHHAARTGMEKIIRLLVEAGADMDIRDNRGNKPEDYAHTDGLKALFPALRKEVLEKELSGFQKGLPRPIKATKPLGKRMKP